MIKVPDDASYAAMLFLHKLMAKRAGPSTGTNLWGAFELIADMAAAGEEGSIVSLICDSGERYSQTYYDDVWLARRKIDLRRWRRQLQAFVETGEWAERQPRAWRTAGGFASSPPRVPDGENPAGRRQRDEPRHVEPPAGEARLRRGGGRRRCVRRRSRGDRTAGSHPDGSQLCPTLMAARRRGAYAPTRRPRRFRSSR